MAFGARELRLILSIQSYGTGNITRIRRDIMQLNQAGLRANANQLAVSKQIEQVSARSFATQKRIRGLERRALSAQGIGPMRAREKLMQNLNKLGYRGIVLEDAMSGKIKLKNAQAQAMVNTLRAEAVVHKEIERALATENAQYKSLTAQARQLVTVEQFRAATLDRQITKMTALQQREARMRMVSHAGRTAQFGGLVTLAALGTAANTFADFNKQVTLAATQARLVDEPFQMVAVRAEAITHGFRDSQGPVEGIIDLMKQFPATGEEMAQASYDIFSSMDVGFGGGMRLMKSFNQLAIATGSDLAVAVDAGITVMNNFDKSTGGVNKQLNLMMTIIRFGRMRLEDLNGMLEKIAPAATASGQSLANVSGAMIAITRLQPSQRVGATGIARLLQTFRDPDFQRGAAKFGVDITKGAGAVGELKPLPQIISQLAGSFGLFEKFGGPGQLFQELTAVGRGRGIGRASRIEAQNAFVFLVGHINEYLALQRRATEENTEFSDSLAAMSASPGVRWEVLMNQFRAFVLILGEAALPALIKLGEGLMKVLGFFESLSKSTRGSIGSFLVYGGAIALVAGTLVNFVAGIATAIISLRIMRLALEMTGASAQVAAGKMGMMVTAAKVLSGVGLISIPIMVQAMKGGDPGAWDMLAAAGMGAAGGAMVGGPAGAIAGAILTPLTIKIMAEFQREPRDVAEEAYEEYRSSFGKFGQVLKAIGPISPIKDFEDWIKEHPKLQAAHEKFLNKFGEDEMTLEERVNKATQGFIRGNQARQKALDDAYKEQDNKQKIANRRAVSIAKAHANAVQQAMDSQEQKIETALDAILQKYDEFEQQNKQALGTFGQGPVMQGMLGGIFTGINDMLRQFGVSIPIPFDILKMEMDTQLMFFKRWRTALDNLLKAGAPLEFVQQIQALGPETGLPIAEGLLTGGKKGVKSLSKEFDKGLTAVNKATKKDMDNQLEAWQKHGKNIAWQIINGLSANQANLKAGYKKYIVDNFSSILNVEFKKEVADFMKDAMEDINAAAIEATKALDAQAPDLPKEIKLTPAQKAGVRLFRTRERLRRHEAQVARLGAAAVSPQGPGGQVITRAEDRAILAQQQEVLRLQNIEKVQAKAFQRAKRVANIQGQIRSQERVDPKSPKYIITYDNQTYTFNSTMTAKQIMREIERRRAARRAKQQRD